MKMRVYISKKILVLSKILFICIEKKNNQVIKIYIIYISMYILHYRKT